MPAITVDDTLVLPRIPRPDPADLQAAAGRQGRHRPPPDRGRRVQRPPALPRRAVDGRGRPVPAARPPRPAGQRPGRGQGRAVASAPRLRDRELHPRRRDRPPRHQRRRRRDRRGRHPVDDRRRRHPARRAADREDVPRRRPVARRAAVGQPPAGAEDDAAALPVDHPGRASPPHLRRRRRADPAHRRRHRRLQRARASPTPRSPTPT